MSGLVKKVLAALAVKEGIEKIQEMRRPKRSFLSRMKRPVLLLGLAGGAVYLQQTGKLGPLLQQAKGLAGSPSSSIDNSAPTVSNGSTPMASTTAGSTSL
jgi:hypothetical protein